MKTADTGLERSTAKIGMWMILLWFLIMGPLGFAVLSGVAYAMYFGNLAFGVVCVLIMFSPLLLLGVWLFLMGATLILEPTAEKAPLAPETTSG
jgi:hypothetical protein